jgi:hypothetical protein
MTALEALHQWPFAVWLRASPYAYPTLETIHILGVACTFGSIVVLDSLILRARHDALALKPWTRTLLPWTLFGFTLAAITGSLMFLARATDMISNTAFVLKIVLLCVVGANAGMLHARGAVDPTNGLTRAQALASIVIWMAIITCGRWIAYV